MYSQFTFFAALSFVCLLAGFASLYWVQKVLRRLRRECADMPNSALSDLPGWHDCLRAATERNLNEQTAMRHFRFQSVCLIAISAFLLTLFMQCSMEYVESPKTKPTCSEITVPSAPYAGRAFSASNAGDQRL